MLTIIAKGTSKEEINQRINKAISKNPKKDVMKFAGKLKLAIDPLQYQAQMRNEWK
ncbi:MAG: hypothetical protein H7Y07_18300 [Pyrinomonadaceae bacterium]|nr:hypothetical protein [Sphingobacteriaceae bacterium]